MATRFEKRDAEKVLGLVAKVLDLSAEPTYSYRLRTDDSWDVLVSGWGFKEGWERSFMVSPTERSEASNSDQYVHTRSRGDRYEGRGWHVRMANDIVEAIGQVRAARAAAVK